MVTLTGAPGIGKTRLALEVAADQGRYWPVARFVGLAPVARPADVARAVASALAVDEAPGQSLIDALVSRLRRKGGLLVLDNCEHLIRACAELVDTLLRGCPELRVLATSREPLAVEDELVWQVGPLAVPAPAPEPPQSSLDYAAVRLFVERARTVEPRFAANAYVAAAVGQICRRLDGIPLAIELAAVCVESLTPEEIVRRLDARFGLLTNGDSADRDRHRTLQAALDWSHELLEEPERTLLRRLSVFSGGFEADAVEAVCTGGEVEAGEALDHLERLVSKSLVVVGSPSRRGGYQLLETIRAYAGDRLEEAAEAPVLRAAHARFYLALAEQAEPELTGPSQQDWLERLEAERSDLHRALEWSLSHGDRRCALRLAGALTLFWRVRCHFSEGRELLDAAVSVSDGEEVALRAKALWGAGFMALMLGEIDRAVSSLEESLDGFRECGEPDGCARALLLLGNCDQFLPSRNALPRLEESAALARKAGDSWCLAHALGVTGLDYASRHELPAARRLFEECLSVAREAQDKQSLRLGLFGLGSVALRQGEIQLAESVLQEAVELTGELGEDYSHATALQYLGQLAFERGDYGRARKLLDDALAVLRDVGPPLAPADALAFLGHIDHAKGDRHSAGRRFEEVLRLSRAAGSVHLLALEGMARLAVEDANPDAARRLLEEALEHARRRSDKGGTARALYGLGDLARVQSGLRRAAALHGEALRLQHESGSAPGVVASLEAVAGVAVQAGRYKHAARLIGAAQARRERGGYARAPWQASRYEADLALVRRFLPAAELETELAEGAALPIEAVVVEAAASRRARRRHSSGWSSLTESERQVAVLVAEGMSNPQVAERLFVSRGTVKFHLANIFGKLGLGGRTQLAREVWRHQQAAPENDR